MTLSFDVTLPLKTISAFSVSLSLRSTLIGCTNFLVVVSIRNNFSGVVVKVASTHTLDGGKTSGCHPVLPKILPFVPAGTCSLQPVNVNSESATSSVANSVFFSCYCPLL